VCQCTIGNALLLSACTELNDDGNVSVVEEEPTENNTHVIVVVAYERGYGITSFMVRES